MKSTSGYRDEDIKICFYPNFCTLTLIGGQVIHTHRLNLFWCFLSSNSRSYDNQLTMVDFLSINGDVGREKILELIGREGKGYFGIGDPKFFDMLIPTSHILYVKFYPDPEKWTIQNIYPIGWGIGE